MSLSQKPPSCTQSKFYHPDTYTDDSRLLFSTNNVLIQKKCKDQKEDAKQVNVYLPGYLRAKAKNINDVDLTNLTSSINMDLIYDIYFGDLFESDDRFKKTTSKRKDNGKKMTHEEQLLMMFQNDFKLTFSRGDSVLLAQVVNEEQNLQIKVRPQKDNRISFTVRKVFSLHMDGNIWLSPFQLLNSILQITIHPLSYRLIDTNYTFRINLMNHPQSDVKLSFPQNKLEFGKYQLAKNLTRSAYTNEKMEKPKQFYMTYEEHQDEMEKRHAKNQGKSVEQYRRKPHKDKVIKYFQYGYFNLPIYKHPFDTIITSIIPIWLLGLINLGIFFQDENLNDRLGSIIALVIALITYIPTIEQTTPPTPNLVMVKLMVYLQIAAVICTFIHSMRVKFETKFRLDWKQTPEYWIAFLMLVISATTVIILTIVHYAYWKRLYNHRKYAGGRRHHKKEWKKEKAKFMLYSMESTTQTQAQKLMIESVDKLSIKAGHGIKFKKNAWNNLECDVYFNRFFFAQRQRVKNVKKQDIKEEKNNEYAEYFVVRPRKVALTSEQVHNFYELKLSDLETQSSLISLEKTDTQSNHKIQYPSVLEAHKTCFPLVRFNYENKSQTPKSSDLKQINLYLPAFMRVKFKNFNSLDFDNLGGDLNATMILTVYYGTVFEYLSKQIGLRDSDKKWVMQKMKNDFVLLFDKDEALQLTEGRLQKDNQEKENDEDGNQSEEVKPVRNIDLTIKQDPKKKCLQFTIRRIFQTRIQSSIFLTPIQKLKTSIDITINSIKIPLKTKQLKTTLVINVNLMDTRNKSDKISISEVKKFCRYGLIISELDIGYYNNKLEAEKEFKRFGNVGSFWQRRKQEYRAQEEFKRVCGDLDKVFRYEKYTAFRGAYRKLGEKDQKIRQYMVKNDYAMVPTQLQIKYLQANSQQKKRTFNQKSSYEPFKYASIVIPLYKFPFDSMAIIFFPLWLLGLLNLGIFFQTQQFGERIISIAALLIAFVSLIPTIRDRIPPSPSITLVEYLVAALLFTCFLTLGHSMSIRFRKDYQFLEWGNDAWFVVALVITLLTVLVVVVLMIYHYVVLDPKYKAKLPKENKFDRRLWENEKCQNYTTKRFSFELHSEDKKNPEHLVYRIDSENGPKLSTMQSIESIRSEQDQNVERTERKQSFMQKISKYICGVDEQRNSDSQNRKGKRAGSQGTLRQLKEVEDGI